MNAASLIAWMATVLAGLVLLVIWLMEYDREFQTAAATRLPVPVISAHALLGIGGLMAWGFYLVTDADQLAWATVADLVVAVALRPDHGGPLDRRVPRVRCPGVIARRG